MDRQELDDNSSPLIRYPHSKRQLTKRKAKGKDDNHHRSRIYFFLHDSELASLSPLRLHATWVSLLPRTLEKVEISFA